MNQPLVQSITSQLIVRLRDRILAGDYPPGSALRQDTLAAEFGISKIPVREALVQLQSEGLVSIYPNRGFQVRPLIASELEEVFSLRLQIEPAAAASGSKLAESSDKLSARQALDRLNDALAREEFSASGQLNRSFHLQLVIPRLQPIAAEILSRLHTLAQRYVQAHLRPEGRANRASQEHATLLSCWCAGDAMRVRELMHGHIESTRDDLTRAVSDGQKAAAL